MRAHVDTPSEFILPLSACFAIPFLGMCNVWFLWKVTTVQISEQYSDGTWSLISSQQFWSITALNLIFFVWATGDLVRAWVRKDTYRRPHLAGAALAWIGVLLVQFALGAMSGPNA